MKNTNQTSRFRHRPFILRVLNTIKTIRLENTRAFFHGDNLRIMGPTPYFKVPKGARGVLRVGSNVVLNSDSKNSNTNITTRVKFVVGYEGNITIGDNCDLNGVCIVSYKNVIIGNYCQIASSTLISDTDFHPTDNATRLAQMKGMSFDYQSVKKSDVVIGDNVWIGWGCVILKGAIIGNNCIVGAGSVVLGKEYPDNCIIAGNPARVVKINE